MKAANRASAPVDSLIRENDDSSPQTTILAGSRTGSLSSLVNTSRIFDTPEDRRASATEAECESGANLETVENSSAYTVTLGSCGVDSLWSHSNWTTTRSDERVSIIVVATWSLEVLGEKTYADPLL